MSAMAPAGHRCRVRFEDIEAEGRRLDHLDRRQLLSTQEFAGRLDRLRANIERCCEEMDWLTPETKEFIKAEMAEIRSEIAVLRKGSDG